MLGRAHHYQVACEWTGNRGTGTSSYAAYGREHRVTAPGRPAIDGSADPAFRGDASRYNPEEMLVAALSACHMLWYLHLCSDAGVIVTGYLDEARGTMREAADGGGEFSVVTLAPRVTISAASDAAQARALHARAHALCFIARSVKFPVRCEPTIVTAANPDR